MKHKHKVSALVNIVKVLLRIDDRHHHHYEIIPFTVEANYLGTAEAGYTAILSE